MILAAFVTAILLILINRWLAMNYYFSGYAVYYKIGQFVVGLLRYIIIGYLTIAFYKKKVSLGGEYYNIFKVAMLLAVFSFLHRSVIGYVSQKAPEIFFTNWMNIEFFTVSLFWYYLLACVIYYFDKNKL